MPRIPPPPPPPNADPVVRARVVCVAPLLDPVTTSSPAASVPLTTVTAACAPLTSPTFTVTREVLPLRRTISVAMLPACGAMPAALDVWPHGDDAAPFALLTCSADVGTT